MAKTINAKIILEKIKKILPESENPPDLSDPEVIEKHCREYGEAIAPEIRKIDQDIARSYEKGMFRVIRRCYSN